MPRRPSPEPRSAWPFALGLDARMATPDPSGGDLERCGAVAVPQRVRERLLRDAVGRDIDAGRQRGQVLIQLQLDVEPTVPELADQVVEVGHARGRGEPELVSLVADDVEQPAGLDEGAASGVGDVAQHPLGLVRVGTHQVLGGGRLHHHRAHRVRDDVVQLAGDPVAFGAHGLTLDQLLTVLDQCLLHRHPQHHPPEDVRRHDQRRHEEDVADVVLAGIDGQVLDEERQPDQTEADQATQVGDPAAQRVDRDPHRQDRRRGVLELLADEHRTEQDQRHQRADDQGCPATLAEQRARDTVDQQAQAPALRAHREQLDHVGGVHQAGQGQVEGPHRDPLPHPRRVGRDRPGVPQPRGGHRSEPRDDDSTPRSS